MDNVFEKGCLIQLSTSVWGGRIKLPPSFITGADPKFVTASKFLVDRDCLKPIEQLRGEARNYIYGKSLPFPVPGVLFVPRGMIGEIDKKLEEYQQEFNKQVDEFASHYSVFITQAKDKLGTLYNPTDYPQNIKQKFGFEWRFLVIDTPGSAGLLSPELYEREQAKFIQTMDEFQDMAIQTLRSTFAEMIDRVVDRLLENKKFKDSTIENLKEFLKDFNSLNITNDVELATLVEKCSGIIDNSLNPQDLRDDNKLREHIAKQMQEVQKTMMDSLIAKPTRKLRVA